jgi:K+ transporter
MVEIPFESIPTWFYSSIIISTCATIIASQALIMEALIISSNES